MIRLLLVLVVSLSRPISPQQAAACAGGRGHRAICFRANPFSTRGEAEEIGRLAREHRWTKLDVVTSSFHVFRARILVKRCTTAPCAWSARRSRRCTCRSMS